MTVATITESDGSRTADQAQYDAFIQRSRRTHDWIVDGYLRPVVHRRDGKKLALGRDEFALLAALIKRPCEPLRMPQAKALLNAQSLESARKRFYDARRKVEGEKTRAERSFSLVPASRDSELAKREVMFNPAPAVMYALVERIDPPPTSAETTNAPKLPELLVPFASPPIDLDAWFAETLEAMEPLQLSFRVQRSSDEVWVDVHSVERVRDGVVLHVSVINPTLARVIIDRFELEVAGGFWSARAPARRRPHGRNLRRSLPLRNLVVEAHDVRHLALGFPRPDRTGDAMVHVHLLALSRHPR